jgi:hypothetical protein
MNDPDYQHVADQADEHAMRVGQGLRRTRFRTPAEQSADEGGDKP